MSLARDNPFATSRSQQLLSFRPELYGTSWHDIETRWRKLGQRASLVAPHGAGKTTFIDTFAARLRAEDTPVCQLFLNRENRKLTEAQWQQLSNCSGKIVILDGEEQLSFLDRRRFQRLSAQAAGVLISRHTPHRYPALLEFKPSVETLSHCVHILAPDHHDALAPHFPHWWDTHHGNIREILLECYDFLARNDEV